MLSVPLASLGTDDQNIDVLTLSAATNILTVGIENGADLTVDLSGLVADGSETIVTGAGINVVTGTGTTGDPYIITATEIDGSVTNEIQDLNLTGNILTITNNTTATDINLAPYLDNTDTQLTQAEIETMGFVTGAHTTDNNTTYTADESSLTLTGTTFGVKADGILTSHIKDGEVKTDDLAADAITEAKIADDAVQVEHIHQNGAATGQALVWNGTAWAPTTVYSPSISEIIDLAGEQLITDAGVAINFNDDSNPVNNTTDYTSSGNSITINTTGNYKITYRVTVYMGTNQNTRTGSEYTLLLDDVAVAGTYSSNYHRNRNVDRTTATMTKILALTKDQVIKVEGKRYYGTADIKTKAGGSSLLIEKL